MPWNYQAIFVKSLVAVLNSSSTASKQEDWKQLSITVFRWSISWRNRILRMQPEWWEVIFRMPKLKDFMGKIEGGDLNLDWIKLPQNNSIEEIHLFDGINRAEIIIKSVVEKTPNLKQLEIINLTGESFIILDNRAEHGVSCMWTRFALSSSCLETRSQSWRNWL